MDSFTSFYLNKELADANRNKRGIEDETPESNSVLAEDTESGLEKRNGLDSFTSFYLPKVNANKAQGKRDGLNSFSSFYVPKEAGRPKRQSLDSFSSFYRALAAPKRSRRSLLRSFAGFYLPYAAENDLE